MAVPDFQSFFKPLLEIAADGKEHSMQEARELIARTMNLSEEDMKEQLPSGAQTKYDNRVAWAKSYFVQAKVLEAPRRAYFRITDRGRDLLKMGYDRIDVKILNQYPEFIEFHTVKAAASTELISEQETSQLETPEETLQKAYQNIRGDLAAEILDKIKGNSPQFFERLVVDIMVALGYGGSRVDAGKSIGQSGDEGIDGIIKEDRLGLDVIYLQAKRWDGTVGRPEIQKFVGALHGKRAKKGVFITTGRFSEDAVKYVESIDPKVILIDGKTLCELMIDYDLGTATTAKYEIKRMDTDYFTEE
jgi:restriction system protein